MRRWMLIGALLAAGCAGSPRANASQPCETAPMPCTFEGAPFTITVVDGDTRQPLADVHVLAEWRFHGVGGGANGPVMVQDAVSGEDGVVRFPAWGPLEGPRTGLVIGHDPIVTLFKTGYRPLVLGNGYLPPARERERVRRFAQDGRTYGLEPFRGSPAEWIKELERVWLGLAVPRNDELTLRFRDPYLNRLGRIAAERDKLPSQTSGLESFSWALDRQLRFHGEGRR